MTTKKRVGNFVRPLQNKDGSFDVVLFPGTKTRLPKLSTSNGNIYGRHEIKRYLLAIISICEYAIDVVQRVCKEP